MNAFSQDTRIGRLATVLGPEELVLLRFKGSDSINGLFEFHIDALSTKHDIEFDDLIGTHASIEVQSQDGLIPFDGIVTEARWLGPSENGWRYELILRPWFWLSGKRRNQRIFHNKTAAEILEKVFEDYAHLGDPAFELQLSEDLPSLEYTVQYRESDLDFARRLMERFGLSFHFRYAPGSHTMVITDRITAHQSIGTRPFHSIRETHIVEEEHFWDWSPARRFTTGAIRLTDYNFKTPTAGMETDSEGDAEYAEGKIESFDYPGDYLDQGAGQTVASRRSAEERGADIRYDASGDCVALRPGCLITQGGGDYCPGIDEEYLCLAAEYQCIGQGFGSGGVAGDEKGFEAKYKLQPVTAPMIPPRQTALPDVRGPQTATVVGDGEIDCDEFGRIIVRFHWDLHEEISMRCRVSQSWAGNGWGGVVIPRIGMEVLVEFLEGDPDKPLVVGSVYNGKNALPYPLDEHKTKAVFRTDTHKGTGFNEIVFEDEAGQEHIAIKAQQDMSQLVLNDSIDRIKRHQISSIGSNQISEIGKNQKTGVGGSLTTVVGGTGSGAASVIGTLGPLAAKTSGLINKAASEGGGGGGPLGKFASSVGSLALGFLSASGLKGRSGLHGADENGTDANHKMRKAGSKLGQSGSGLFDAPGTMNVMVTNFRSDTTGVAAAEQVGLAKVVNVGGALMETVGKARVISIGEKLRTTVGKLILTKTKKHTLIATEKFTIAGPGGSIEINQSGMTINASKLLIKSPSVDFVPGASAQTSVLKAEEPFCEKCRGSKS